jgi:acetyl esterase/lipase
MVLINISIDPQSKAFLQSLQSGDGKKLEQMEIDEARGGMKALLLAHQVLCSAGNVILRKELIQGHSGPVSIRIYQAKVSAHNENPVILFCHGGGWALGDLDCYETMLQYLCEYSKATFISVEYGLAPEHKFPHALNDCYKALLWAAQHGAEFNSSMNKIVVMGDSAGGNLAAALCLHAMENGGPEIFAQCLLYPQLSLLQGDSFQSRDTFGAGDYFISKESIAWAIEHYLNNIEEASSVLASPLLTDDFSQFPRSMIVTAGLDPLHDEAELFAARLRDAGVDTEYRCFEQTIHGFLSFAGTLDIGIQGLDYISDWIKQLTN